MLSPEFPPPETPQTRAEALSARIKSENLHGLTREINSRRRNSRRRIRPGKRSCHFRCLRRTEFPPFLPPTGGETPSRIRAGSSPTHRWSRSDARISDLDVLENKANADRPKAGEAHA